MDKKDEKQVAATEKKKGKVEQGEIKKEAKTEDPKPAEGKAEKKKGIEGKKGAKKEAAPKAKKSSEKKTKIPKEPKDENYISPNSNLNFLAETRKDLPQIKIGDTLRIMVRVIEGGKERTQAFEGVVIAMKGSGIAKNITVRKTSFGIAVERIFPLNSKLVHSIEVKKHAKIRRAKLYYLRNLRGKAARLKELR